MAIKSFTGIPENGVPLPLYTVPAGKTAIIKMLLGTPFVGNQLTSTLHASIDKVVPLVSANSLAVSGVSKLLDDFVVLNQNETLYVENATPNASRYINKTILPANPLAFMCNNAGNTFLVYLSGLGIWRSTDDCVTWTQVYSANFTPSAWAYIAGSFFFYDTAGNYYRSTDDGVNWTTGANPNMPTGTTAVSTSGRLAKNGDGVFCGFLSGTDARLTYTTDGINWSTCSVLCSGNPTGVVWAGNKWVVIVQANTGNGIFYKADITNGTAWAAASGPGALDFVSISTDMDGVTTGSGTCFAIATNLGYWRSIDLGINWTRCGTATVTASSLTLFANNCIYGGNTSGSMNYWKLPINTSNTTFGTFRNHTFGSANTFVKNNKIYGVSANYIWATYSLTPQTDRKYGASFHLTVAEV